MQLWLNICLCILAMEMFTKATAIFVPKATHSIVVVSILQFRQFTRTHSQILSSHLAFPPLPEPCVTMKEQSTRLPGVISVTLSILEYMFFESGNEKVSSGNLGSGTLTDKTPAHWRRPTESWWSDPRSELLDWQNPETGPKLSADPRSTVFFKSANPLDLSPKSTIRELFKAKSADPRTYSPPSLRHR